MSKDSTLILDARSEDWIEYRDRTSGDVRWLVIINQHSNYRNRRRRLRSKYLVYDKRGDLANVVPLNSRWEVGVFIAEQEGTYANHERMVECVGSSTVKVTAPWATDDEKREMAMDYMEMVLGHEVPIRKSRTDPPSVYYKIQRRSVVPLDKERFSHVD